MNRKEIHQNITMLLGKIHYLNEKLGNQNELHPVELDLFDGYIAELVKLKSQLHENDELAKVEQELLEQEVEEKNYDEVETKEVSVEDQPAPIEDEVINDESEKEEPEPEIESEENLEVEISDDHSGKSSEIESKKEDETEDVTEQRPDVKPEPEKKVEVKDEEVSLNDRFTKAEVAVGDKLARGEASRKPLKDRFDLNQRYQFIQELFDGKSEEFNAALKQLENCGTKGEIESLFDEQYEKYNWSDKLKMAESLKKSALNYFQN